MTIDEIKNAIRPLARKYNEAECYGFFDEQRIDEIAQAIVKFSNPSPQVGAGMDKKVLDPTTFPLQDVQRIAGINANKAMLLRDLVCLHYAPPPPMNGPTVEEIDRFLESNYEDYMFGFFGESNIVGRRKLSQAIHSLIKTGGSVKIPEGNISKNGNSIFDLVEGFLSVDPKDLKAYREAVDKILPEIDEILYKRRVAAEKARRKII